MISAPIVSRTWFDRPSVELAPRLLGARLLHDAPEGTVGGLIVEVEAYSGPEDVAAHSSRGRTGRNGVMFGPPGHLYVYLIYGLHHCMNVVAGPGDKPEAVLIRAIQIDEGIELARARRGPRAPHGRLAAGPGNVGQALGIDRSHDGIDLLAGPIRIEPRSGRPPPMRTGPRVGVAYAGDWAARPMRYWIADDPNVSRR
ncbi:MAG: DNA-3-methyladenine glycosylase [Chloroflexota bacterium]|nr:DNA-3-methyladenine glycosylase [Chloroflexota bacterium]